jgi:prepilin-type N-terminal cleavage/methylation domain-containing protein
MKKQSNLLIKNKQRSKGFSLIEVAISLATMGVCLAYAMPVILYSKVNSKKSEIRAGALMISQKIFDDVRSRNFSEIPKTNRVVTETDGSAAYGTLPALPPLPSTQTKAFGRSYNVALRYCEVESECSDNYKTFKITIRDPQGSQSSDQSIIYEMEAAFTDFK